MVLLLLPLLQLAQVKDATRAMLDQLKAIAAEHPEASVAQQVIARVVLALLGSFVCGSQLECGVACHRRG